jgi:hypothetical protein
VFVSEPLPPTRRHLEQQINYFVQHRMRACAAALQKKKAIGKQQQEIQH